jgi:hypothetical protein
MVAGAAAEIALQPEWEVFPFLLRKTRGRHDHARRAESTLESLRIEERLLHRVKRTIARESFDGFDLASFGTKRRHEAAVDWFAVEPDRACTAVACIASLFYSEPPEVTDECSQALAGARLGVKRLSVDFVAHEVFLRGKLLANLFREVVRKMLTVRRGPVRVVKVKLERYSVVDSQSYLIR